MQTGRELFVHELTDMLDAEQKLIEALGIQAGESTRPELKKAFEAHQQQTEKQAERLRSVFELLGEEPEESECKGIKGLIEEHDTFMQEEEPSEDLVDIFNVGAASKVESYEIQGYASLIQLAEQLGETKAVRLLNQNLKEEQQTLKKMEGFSKKLKPAMLEEESEEEEGEDMELEMEEETSARKAPSRASRPRRGRAA